MKTGRPPITLDIKTIVQLYCEDKQSSQTIGTKMGVHAMTVRRRLVAQGITIRSENDYPVWNNGLTVDTDERVKNNSRKTTRFSGHQHTPESKVRMAHSQHGKNTWSKGSKSSDSTKAKIGNASRKLWQNPEYRQQQIDAMKAKWADPEYAARVRPLIVAGNIKKPTYPEERLLQVIIKNKLPFKYTGDGGITIGGMVPDFTNINGKKEVVEVFGDYWHSAKKARTWKATELGRIMAYNAFGFNCIVIWEHEIKTMTEEEMVGRLVH